MSEPGSERYGSLDESQLLFQQIRLIQRTLAGDIKSLDTSDETQLTMDVWATRVAAAVSGLESVLSPVLPEEWEDNWSKNPGKKNPGDKVDYHLERWEALMEIISDHKIAFSERTEFVIDDNYEGDE